ncbi:hypothetical protein [Embleya sp. NPDC005971]|uniref:HEAT repeat domain-containing protein n=1 Tax=Embleya sp. NPDC005971 TaxID=3156724 RepID=UPI003407FDCC
MGFKEDEDFARYLTMGAHGTVALKSDLERRGHRIIELERYSMGNKVWSVKVKRLRIPDLVCVRCGRRFESKAKSKLELKLSHSATVGREWHAGGMRDEDVFGFIRIVLEGGIRAGKPLYVTRKALWDALGSVKEGTRKAISAGSEADVSWPIWVPGYAGCLLSIMPMDGEGNVTVQRSNGGTRTYKRNKMWTQVHAYLQPGEPFEAASTAVAGSVAPADVSCAGDIWDWGSDLASASSGDRYAAVKSCYVRSRIDVDAVVREIARNCDEDWRVRLEAIGVLASRDEDSWVPMLRGTATDVLLPPEQQIESVFLLTELASLGVEAAAEALYEVAVPNADRKDEVRAAAVWGLGLGAATSRSRVVDFFADADDRVALHAASSLANNLPTDVLKSLQRWMVEDHGERRAAVAASVLARHGQIQSLLDVVETSDSLGSKLALRALGDLSPSQVKRGAGREIPVETLRILEVVWAQHHDWLRHPENLGALDILDKQQIRFS